MKHALAVLLSFVLLTTGCPSGTASDAGHGHDHGSDAGDGHGASPATKAHGHDGGASDGVIARITQADTSEKVGYLRLKLHDDKGDLEIWLVRDADFSQPFDVPLDSTITVTFTGKDNRTVTLAVRNRNRNEGEDGKANVRDGKTNYFIFPGDTGTDASWLKGADFLSTVKVGFSADAKKYATSQFVLRPHTHGEGHPH